MLEHLKLTILAENRAANPHLLAEQGLSILVRSSSGSLLFDTGQTDAFLRNARQLKIDLSKINIIVLSHGHYDHTGGLPFFIEKFGKVKVICHPAIVNKKFKVYPGGRLNIGVPWEEHKIRSAGADFIFKTNPAEIMPDIWISGEIPRNSKYEHIDERYQERVLESYIHDELHDDMALILNTVKGLVILLGCGHSGVINTARHAMRIMNNKNIFAIMGGMHLSHTPKDRLEQIVGNLKRINPQFIVPLHCTGFEAIDMMFRRFKNRVKLFNVGDTFDLDVLGN